MGLLKKILKKRQDLRVIISSATLDAEALRDYFQLGTVDDPSSTILTVEGRTFPVDIFYLKDSTPNYLNAVVETVLKIHRTEPLGDVLAFLTGQEEVDHVCQVLDLQVSSLSFSSILPLLNFKSPSGASQNLKILFCVKYYVTWVQLDSALQSVALVNSRQPLLHIFIQFHSLVKKILA
jgi:HrpA-like RNA helicase